jgi:hypothetical protein
MKKSFLVLILPVLIFSCSGSDKYQGKWHALNRQNHKFEFAFSPENFTITDSTGTVRDYSYTQNSYNASNSAVTYGIKLSDGRAYQITFPKSEDASVAVMADGTGTWMFTLGRKAYVTYELYGLAL